MIPLPLAMLHDIHITNEEEHALRIPIDHVPYKLPLSPLEDEASASTAFVGAGAGAAGG